MRIAILAATMAGLVGGATCAAAAESSYTRHVWDECRQIAAEDDSVTRRCSGFGGVPVLYTAASDAASVGFGQNGLTGESNLGSFFFPRETVEWRTKAGKPFAAILRYDIGPSVGGPFRSWLAVYKLQGVKSSCIVALVDGARADANAHARELADTGAQGFKCERDMMLK